MEYNELVILGLLMEGPRHGYGLHRLIKERAMDEYIDLAASSMYKTLNRLAEAGAIESRPEKVGPRPERQVYHITVQGEERLKELIRKMLCKIERYYDPLIAALTFAHYVPQAEVINAVQKRQGFCLEHVSHLKDVLEHVRSISKQQYGVDTFYAETILKGGIKMLTANAEWFEEIVEGLGEREK